MFEHGPTGDKARSYATAALCSKHGPTGDKARSYATAGSNKKVNRVTIEKCGNLYPASTSVASELYLEYRPHYLNDITSSITASDRPICYYC